MINRAQVATNVWKRRNRAGNPLSLVLWSVAKLEGEPPPQPVYWNLGGLSEPATLDVRRQAFLVNTEQICKRSQILEYTGTGGASPSNFATDLRTRVLLQNNHSQSDCQVSETADPLRHVKSGFEDKNSRFWYFCLHFFLQFITKSYLISIFFMYIWFKLIPMYTL